MVKKRKDAAFIIRCDFYLWVSIVSASQRKVSVRCFFRFFRYFWEDISEQVWVNTVVTSLFIYKEFSLLVTPNVGKAGQIT